MTVIYLQIEQLLIVKKIRVNNKDYLYILWDILEEVFYRSSNKIFIKDSK